MAEQAPLWGALLAAVVVGLLALAGAVLDAALRPAARPSGVAVGAGGGGADLLAPLRATARLLVQRRRTTLHPDALLWRVGGGGLLVVAVLKVAPVPLAGWAVLAVPVGVVWVNAVDVLLWAVVWLAGWGANATWPLVSGYRFLAMALSYELPLMFALTGPAVAAGSLDLATIAAAQADGLWYAVTQPAAFLVFLASVVAFSLWGPGAYPLGTDVVGGLLAEPSGPDRLVVLAGRYALLAAGSVVAVPLFLGGGAGPLLPGPLWVLVKAAVVLAALVAVRDRLPVLRADRLMAVAWLMVLPVVLLQVLVVSVLVLVGEG